MVALAAALNLGADDMPFAKGSSAVMGALPDLRADPLGFFMRGAEVHGDVFRARAAFQTLVVLRKPEDIQRVLADNHRNYTKRTKGYEVMRAMLGNGLVTSSGDFWLRQRRIAQPAFQRDRINTLSGQMTDAALEMLTRWDPLISNRATVDISTEMMRLTLTIVSRTLLSKDVSSDFAEVGEALFVALEETNQRITEIISVPRVIPTPANRRFNWALGTLNRVVDNIIAERRRHGSGTDLLGLFMDTRDEQTGEHMTDVQLRDEVMTMLLAGHETTAMLLTWTFYLLSTHPEVEARLVGELDRVLNGRAPTLADLKDLQFTERVLKEVLRLYPPAWMIARYAEDDDVISTGRIRKNEFVFLSPYITHRHPGIWENPEGFDPDRFLPERFKHLHKFAYFPFSGGQRKCIGDHFAMMEAQLILATVLQRVRPSLVSGHRVEMDTLITLRPRYGMKMRLDRSHKATVAAAVVTSENPPVGCPMHRA